MKEFLSVRVTDSIRVAMKKLSEGRVLSAPVVSLEVSSQWSRRALEADLEAQGKPVALLSVLDFVLWIARKYVPRISVAGSAVIYLLIFMAGSLLALGPRFSPSASGTCRTASSTPP